MALDGRLAEVGVGNTPVWMGHWHKGNMSSKNIVLYVEDDPNDVLLVRRACRNAKVSFEIQVVTDGQKAIEYLSGADIYSDRQRHPLPEMIMLDLKLPRQNGFEILQ